MDDGNVLSLQQATRLKRLQSDTVLGALNKLQRVKPLVTSHDSSVRTLPKAMKPALASYVHQQLPSDDIRFK